MPNMQRPWSVRQQLLLLILVIAISGAALFAWLFAREWQLAQSHAYDRARLLAEGTASRLSTELQARERVLRRFAERPLVRALDPARCDPLIAEYTEVHPEFTGLDLRDVAGNVVCAYRANAPGAAQVAIQAWFQSAVGRDGFGASPAFLSPRTGRWVSVLSQPIRGDGGKAVGLVLLAIDLLELQQRVIGPLPVEALVAVGDTNGNIVLRSRDPEAWLGKPAPPLHLALSRQGAESKIEGVDGVLRLYAHTTVPTLGWQVVAGLPEATVLAQQRDLLARGAGLGLVVLLLMLLLAWWIARSAVGPIRELAAVARRIASGDLQARAGLDGPAEVGVVAQQFNLMLDVRDRSDAERTRVEQALRDRERFTAALVSNLPGMVYRCLNDAEWTMVFVSEGCKSVTGYERRQLEGNLELSFSSLIHADDREARWAKCQVA
ncbi:MAG: cache domain-containing protein, partial [Burkholderiaceae bacterium]